MHKILSIICFIFAAAFLGLYLKEAGYILPEAKAPELQRQKLEITNDEIFENIGFQYFKPNLENSKIGFKSSQIGQNSLIARRGGTRLFFISKDPIANFIKPLSAASNIEIFQDDLGKNMIESGENQADYVKYKENPVNLFFLSAENINGLEVFKGDDGRMIVAFGSAAKVSEKAHELFLKAKLQYLAPKKDGKIMAINAKVEEKESAVGKSFSYKIVSDKFAFNINRIDLLIPEKKLARFKIEELPVKIDEISFTNNLGAEIKAEIKGNEFTFEHVENQKFTIPKMLKIKYVDLETKEIEISQIYKFVK